MRLTMEIVVALKTASVLQSTRFNSIIQVLHPYIQIQLFAEVVQNIFMFSKQAM